MNSPELKEWLGKDDGSGGTVGHERYGGSLLHSRFKSLFLLPFCSGRKIIKIPEKNPSRDPEKYDQNIDRIRRVVAYNKCHLVQGHADSKYAKSLKNWGRYAGKEGQLFFGAPIRIGRDGEYPRWRYFVVENRFFKSCGRFSHAAIPFSHRCLILSDNV
jgi:hypothetical protein